MGKNGLIVRLGGLRIMKVLSAKQFAVLSSDLSSGECLDTSMASFMGLDPLVSAGGMSLCVRVGRAVGLLVKIFQRQSGDGGMLLGADFCCLVDLTRPHRLFLSFGDSLSVAVWLLSV